MTQEDIKASSDVIASTPQMNNLKIYVLFYLGATHSFITSRIVANMGKEARRVERRVTIRKPLGDMVETYGIYVGMRIGLNEYEMEVDLIPLELNDFNAILGMDWLSKHKAQIDYYIKTITFQGLGSRRMVFGGEITTISINLVSAVTARKLLRKGYMGYLAYILNSDKDEKDKRYSDYKGIFICVP